MATPGYPESTLLGSDSSIPSSPTSLSGPTRKRASTTVLTAITASGSEDALIAQTIATPRTPAFAPTFEAIREGRQGDTVEGWPLLAKLMANEADFEAFSRYEELNVKNLLYYQVELASIKLRLERREKSDRGATSGVDEEADFHIFADRLVNSESDQWDEVLKLRTALDGYSTSYTTYNKKIYLWFPILTIANRQSTPPIRSSLGPPGAQHRQHKDPRPMAARPGSWQLQSRRAR